MRVERGYGEDEMDGRRYKVKGPSPTLLDLRTFGTKSLSHLGKYLISFGGNTFDVRSYSGLSVSTSGLVPLPDERVSPPLQQIPSLLGNPNRCTLTT